MITAEEVAALNETFAFESPENILDWASTKFGAGLKLACSLGAEDNVLTAMLASANSPARVFFLDTGRLNPETYQTLGAIRSRYDVPIEVIFPKTDSLQQLVTSKGPFSFYDSVENRKECCHIRKVEPLARALADATAWVTGLRREQAVTRANLLVFEIDEDHGNILKINPLATWTTEQVLEYAKNHRVPLNPLHAKGFPSIGCEPCTRAIEPDEDLRAGRWWWESPDLKECGLHLRVV
jgi:phosphoadenosine phosphosulfate reductase